MTAEHRLRQARDAKGWTLENLAQKTGVRQQVLALIDRGAFSDLPTGVYGRHAVRAYAAAVGLDADQLMREITPLMPALEDPIDGLARAKGLSRRSLRAAENVPAGAPVCAEPPASPDGSRHVAASLLDGLILSGIALGLLQLTSIAAGVTVDDVLIVAGPAIAAISVLIAIAYFTVLGGLRNATIGSRLMQVEPAEPERGPITARVMLRRGMACALRESSVVVEWLLTTDNARHWLRSLLPRRV